MHTTFDGLRLSATDLAHFLSCRHLTALDLGVLASRRTGPDRPPDQRLQRFIERGIEHEKAYVQRLRDQGRQVTDLNHLPRRQPERAIEATLDAMRRGDEIIVQAALRLGTWSGYADVLRRIERPSTLGDWSYEVIDTKLARDTRAGTILQLGLYTSIVGSIQGTTPEEFHVVVPSDDGESTRQISWRTDDFAAYLRLVQQEMLDSVALGDEALASAFYPEPVDYCGLCRWWRQCDDKRHTDDHLSLVANLGRLHRRVLEANAYRSLTALAGMPVPIPFKPRRGSPQTYARAQQQAFVQLESRSKPKPVHALRFPELPPPGKRSPPTPPPPQGFARLPEPSPGDLFLDLEGDRGSEESGREYLFGIAWRDAGGDVRYDAHWAFTAHEERLAFEAIIDRIIAALERDPGMHVYHFAPYEPSAFKRLMGRYATRARELDQLLQGSRFVDLLAVVRQGLFVGVESYSIKELEPCYGFVREVDLREATASRRRMETALYARSPDLVPDEDRRLIEGYNRDDCVSTLRLRDWLEAVRLEAEAQGIPVSRPEKKPGDEQSGERKERDLKVEALRSRLLDGLSDDAELFVADEDFHADDTEPDGTAESPDTGTPGPSATDEDLEHGLSADEERARWVLAYLLDYHRREDKATWWEYFRLRDMTEDELLDERLAVSKLEFVSRVNEGKPRKDGGFSGSVIDRYRYPEQEMDIERGNSLCTATEGKDFAEVAAINRVTRTIDLAKSRKKSELHPTALFAFEYVNAEAIEDAIFAFAESVADAGTLTEAPPSAATELLLRHPPRLKATRGRKGSPFAMRDGETELEAAIRVVQALDHSCLAIQGPPGAGKTYTGAEMICALVKAGKRVGVTANSHKVIRKLLDETLLAAGRKGLELRAGHKDNEKSDDEDDSPDAVQSFKENRDAHSAITEGEIDVLGGTAWLWARPEFKDSVDVLFVDEAGQMALANVIATSQAAANLVLLGDPKQLDQPHKGAHPDGVAVSALEYLMDGAPTLPPDRGIFLPTTWRMSPPLCEFTSELYYRNRLRSKDGLERQALVNAGELTGSGLYLLDVEHQGNRNHSPEEVEAVAALVGQLTAKGVKWRDEHGKARQVTVADILVVAPYNTQVNRLLERLPEGARVGTVDKFQGQQAPVVIYSMATSHPEDAPRGMDFLYSANRLNVATSRAQCAVILVANPQLFKPECRTVKQMKLANGLCRFREMARPITLRISSAAG